MELITKIISRLLCGDKGKKLNYPARKIQILLLI